MTTFHGTKTLALKILPINRWANHHKKSPEADKHVKVHCLSGSLLHLLFSSKLVNKYTS